MRALLALSATGTEGVDQDQAVNADDGQGDEANRYEYALASRDDPDVPPPQVHFLRKIAERQAWRAQLDAAKQQVQQELSATQSDAA